MPEEILTDTCPKKILSKWLCVYVLETRTHDGEPYPSKTIYALLCGILREMRASNLGYPNFLLKENPSFDKFCKTLDNYLKSYIKKELDVIQLPLKLLQKKTRNGFGALGYWTLIHPKLCFELFFIIVANFFAQCEHRNLSLSQLERLYSPNWYVHRENASKNKPNESRAQGSMMGNNAVGIHVLYIFWIYTSANFHLLLGIKICSTAVPFQKYQKMSVILGMPVLLSEKTFFVGLCALRGLEALGVWMSC